MNLTRLLPIVLLLAACASPAEKLCKKVAKCAYQGQSDDGEEWSDEDIDDCVTTFEESREFYEEAGCEDGFDDYLTCAVRKSECNKEDGEIEGAYEACEDELTSLGTCVGSAGF